MNTGLLAEARARTRAYVLLALLALACRRETPAVPDARAPAVTAPLSAVPTPRAPSGPRCDRAAPCPADHFCGVRGLCVSAVTKVVAGNGHSCAIHRNGRVSCWGYSDAVKGIGSEVSSPIEIPNLHDPVALSAGHHLSCAVLPDGRVRCFGLDDFVVIEDSGQPLTGITAVALGIGFGCAGGSAGTYCWGRNEYGQLARPLTVRGSANAALARPGPVRLLGAGMAVLSHAGGTLCAWGNNTTRLVHPDEAQGAVSRPTCTAMSDVVELAVGAAHACVRHRRGTFACWGERYYGQLGSASTATADVAPPGEVITLPAPARALVAGAGHTCALTEGGRVFCFGLNDVGQVGELAADRVRSPLARPDLGGVVALGSGSSAKHTCAVLADGQVACWGNDACGQLGGADPERRVCKDGRFSRAPVRVAF